MAQQRDFFHTLFRQTSDLDENVLKTARHFCATGVGNDAVAAIFAASFHDRYVGDRRFHAGRRKIVEFLDFGKTDVDLCLARFFEGVDHFRQTVQRLGAENEIDVGCTPDECFSFLGGDAA